MIRYQVFSSTNEIEPPVLLLQLLPIRSCKLPVEDEATLDALKEIGVDFVRGYHCGRSEAVENVYQKILASMTSV